MSTAIDINKPRHWQAADWAGQLMEHSPWLERGAREHFLEQVLGIIFNEWSDSKLAFYLATEHLTPESLAADIVREAKEFYGDDSEATHEQST